MSTAPHTQHTEAPQDDERGAYRGIALALAGVVILGLLYGLIDTAMKASALFTG